MVASHNGGWCYTMTSYGVIDNYRWNGNNGEARPVAVLPITSLSIDENGNPVINKKKGTEVSFFVTKNNQIYINNIIVI